MLPSTALPYSTGHGKPSVFNLGFPGLPDLQRLGSSTGLPTPRTPTTPTAGAPNRAAACQAKQAGPDLSAVALSSPLGSTPRGRGVARVMGSPPQASCICQGSDQSAFFEAVGHGARPIAPGHSVMRRVWVPGWEGEE